MKTTRSRNVADKIRKVEKGTEKVLLGRLVGLEPTTS
jgi:hypothetical protein